MRLRWLWPGTVKGRDWLRSVLILTAAALGGYLLTCVAYPAPVMTRDHPLARVLGLPQSEAEKELNQAGLKLRIEAEAADPVIPAGHIVWQDPPPGTVLPRGSLVRLTASSGPAPIAIPDVTGFEVEQARQVIEAAGLRLGDVDTVANAVAAGVVVFTRPATGATRPPAATVGLIVSKGPADIKVPDVVGLDQEEARKRLEGAGLKVGKVTSRDNRAKPGQVLQQRPAAGVFTPHESRVDLVISK